MAPIATFLDTTLPDYAARAAALSKDGWTSVRSTAANRRTILLKYYEYLVNTNAKMAGIHPSTLTPQQLQPVWEKANAEFAKYEMYVKDQAVVANTNTEMGDVSAPVMVDQVFASTNDIERMQPGYVDIDDILAGLSGLKFGGKRKTRKHHSKKRKYTKHRSHRRRHTKRN